MDYLMLYGARLVKTRIQRTLSKVANFYEKPFQAEEAQSIELVENEKNQ